MTLNEAVDALTARGRVLIGIDFDGTLAPLAPTPDLAKGDARALQLVRRLAAQESVDVAIVSGRALADLERKVGRTPGMILIGEHGNDSGDEVDASDTIETARRFIEILRSDRDVVIEQKPRSVTFHTRALTDAEKADAAHRVRIWAAEHPEVTLLEGKEVLELTVATRTKGDVIRDLAVDYQGVIYVGDDVTDETVFAVLGPDDVGVKVGEGPTAAGFRVAGVPEVVDLLEMLVRAGA